MSDTGHSHSEHRRKKDETVTISRSTYRKMLVGIIVLLMAVSFSTGFMFAGGATGQTTTATRTSPSAPSPSPTPQQAAGDSAISVSLDDDPAVGNENAEIVIIEFSDFECPFCGRFFDQTLPQLKSEYVDTGKVYFVYRDFPLSSIHPAAQKAAEAGECADEQNAFWEYHDVLFERQSQWANRGETASVVQFKSYAEELGLNTAQFNECLDSGQMSSEVSSDFSDGSSAGASGTPTFFIGHPDTGFERLVGAQPYSQFKSILDRLLA